MSTVHTPTEPAGLSSAGITTSAYCTCNVTRMQGCWVYQSIQKADREQSYWRPNSLARATSLLNDANSMKYPGSLLNQLNFNNNYYICSYAAPHWFPVYQSHLPMIEEALASCSLHRSTVVRQHQWKAPQLSRYDEGTAGPRGMNKRGRGRYAAIPPSSAQDAVHVRMCNTYLLIVLASAFSRGGVSRHHQLS